MRTAQVNNVVRLIHDVPTLWLSRGDVGVVRSVWMSPASCYEVEFRKPGESSVRALLNADLLERVEPAAVEDRPATRSSER
jgi:hypothetical protein